MPVPPDFLLLKSLADEMAGRLTGGDADTVLQLQRLGTLAVPEGSPPRARPGVVGIWEGGAQGFERSPARREEWHYWANIPSIPPKGERKRVLLVGESVARGFLYDPEFNPAQALEASLSAALGQPVEVVDLAKSDLRAPELPDLVGATPALEPDALVVFAGNNWFLSDKRDRPLEAAALRGHGALGLKELREQRLAAFIEGTLLPQFVQLSTRLPIVLVIPETNLVDWRLDARADAPWLPAGRNRRWLEHREMARAALAASDLDEAEALAREMVELDQGTAASGWTLLADCARARGDLAAARTCLEKARDAHLWDFTHQTPRILSLIQKALRGCAIPGRIAVVDLPACFAAWQEGELPGRRLFLDYCHLTAEGIRVAMAATALEVAALLDPSRPLPALASVVEAIPAPSARLEASAHFAAALHSAHWGQASPIVSYLCQKAVREFPEITRAMRIYLELQVRRTPIWACAAAEGLAAVTTPFLQAFIQQQEGKLFDPVLLPVLAEVLEVNGIPALAFLDRLREEERGLTDRPRDLLDPYHRASWADLDWLEGPAHFQRACSPTSRYPWASSAPGEVVFELTCRRSGGLASGEGQVRINGSRVAGLALTPEWHTFCVSAPPDRVKRGVNWLEIDWPCELASGEAEIAHAAREHEHGRIVALYPVFAEIAALRAARR